MAKIVIELEDTKDGEVRFEVTPTTNELLKLNKETMTVAHVYAIHAITAIIKRDQETKKQINKISEILPEMVQ